MQDTTISSSARTRWYLSTLVVLSIVIRVVYFVQLDDTACLSMHKASQSDMNFFHVWGQRLAEGDWLTPEPFHPQHDWHLKLAESHFAENPGTRETYSAGGKDPSAALWDEWYGGNRFHQEPLYPYLIGATYALFGSDVRWVYAWQMGLGVLTNVLIFLIARRCFGVRAGFVAGLLALFCSPLLFYEMVLLRSTLVTFMGLALVELADRARQSGKLSAWFGVGVACGLGLLLKTTFVLFFGTVVLLLLWKHRSALTQCLRPLAAVTAAALLTVSPAFARNLAVGAPTTSLSSVGAITYVNANAGSRGDLGFQVSYDHAHRIMAETGGAFFPAVVKSLETYESPQSFLYQTWQKFDALWYWHEVPNNVNYYLFLDYAPVLGWLPITFTVLGPLAIVGLLIGLRRSTRQSHVWVVVLTSIAPMLIFYVLSRFRLPLTGVLIPFAAFTVVFVAERFGKRSIRAIGTAVGIVLVCALLSRWTARPLHEGLSETRPYDYAAAFTVHYDAQIQAAVEKQDWEQVVDILEEVLRLEPKRSREIPAERAVEWPTDLLFAQQFGQLNERYAQALSMIGRHSDAAAARDRARELAAATANVQIDPATVK